MKKRIVEVLRNEHIAFFSEYIFNKRIEQYISLYQRQNGGKLPSKREVNLFIIHFTPHLEDEVNKFIDKIAISLCNKTVLARIVNIGLLIPLSTIIIIYILSFINIKFYPPINPVLFSVGFFATALASIAIIIYLFRKLQ